MEASVAAGQVEAGEGQEQSAGDAYAPVLERMDQMERGFSERLDARIGALEQAQQQATAEPQPSEQELFEQQFQELFGEQEQAGFDPAALQQLVAQQAQQAAQPALQEAQALRAELEIERLYEQYPDLRTPEVDQAVGPLVEQYVQRLGLQQPSAALVELAYAKYKADKVASSEVPAGDSHVALEGGGGAAPVLSDDDRRQRIVQAGGLSRPLY